MSTQPPESEEEFQDPADQWVQPDQVPERQEAKPASHFSLTGLAILGVMLVLGAIVAPNFIRARARGQLTACKSNLKNIGTALEMYSTDFRGKYPASMAALTPNYLKTIPQCPSAFSPTYKVYFGPDAPYNDKEKKFADYYFIECEGGHHQNVSVKGNFPAYSGIQGLIERDPNG